MPIRSVRQIARFAQRAARPIGGWIVLAFLLAALGAPMAYAQEVTETPEPFPRVRNKGLREAAERINDMLNGINQRRLAAAERVLKNVQRVLDRVVEVTDDRARRGFDVSAVREAIATARTELDEAWITVRDQSERSYVLDDVTDRNIRDRLRAVRDHMNEDLSKVRKDVRAAISAVRDVVRALRITRRPAP